MKKRRNGDGRRRREEPDLGAFSEDAPPAPPIDPSADDKPRGGGGQSRAARKRAKKRARTAQRPDAAPPAEDAAANGGECGEDQNDLAGDKARKAGKSKGDRSDPKPSKAGEGGGPDRAEKQRRKEKKDARRLAPSPDEADEEEEEDESDDEMGPELESLLSTLTPAQILLLDGNARPSLPLEDDEDGENGGLGGVDPLSIVGDLTAPHRARALLSSIIAPSRVTAAEFYDKHWGKRPLLACLEDGSDEGGGGTAGGEDELDEEDAILVGNHATRLDGLLSRASIDDMMRRNKLRYGLDLNVTRYTDSMGNGVRSRITLDPAPTRRRGGGDDDLEYAVANPSDVWSNVDGSSCTLRLLRPHEHDDSVHSLLSLLESEFGCMVGSNAYLTPRGSQGFAPHYDDVDVFILQLEGYKRWKVYAPFNKRETLPRESSRDYTEKEIEDAEETSEAMTCVLGPGDVLYLPRGWVHQAETVARPAYMPRLPGVKDDHSLHLTVSAMQNWCWADYLEILMPGALDAAVGSDKTTALREGLPRNFLEYMGTMNQVAEEGGGGADLPDGLKSDEGPDGHGDDDGEAAAAEARSRRRTRRRQREFRDEAKKRIMRVCKQAMTMLDDACDEMGKRHMSDRLPPALLGPERALTKDGIASGGGGGAHFHEASKRMWPNTLCRLVRPGVARLVVEDDKAVLYHCLDNSRVYRGSPVSPMEFEVDDAPALEQLLTTVEPRWIMVRDLIHGDVEDKMGIAQALFDEGLLATVLAETPDRTVQTG